MIKHRIDICKKKKKSRNEEMKKQNINWKRNKEKKRENIYLNHQDNKETSLLINFPSFHT